MSDSDNLKSKAKLIWQRLKDSEQSLTAERKKQIIARLQKQKHKPGVNPKDWESVHDNLLLVAEFDLTLCEEMGLPVLYSSIIRAKIVVNGVTVSRTDIHAKKRAYDRSVLGWPAGMAAWIAELVCDAFKIGAISFSDGKEREALFEPSEFDKKGKQIKWNHLHFQVRP